MSVTDDFDLPESQAPPEQCYDTDYETGQDNVQVLGMDLHNPVFFISALVILSFCLGTLAFPETAKALLEGARDGRLPC